MLEREVSGIEIQAHQAVNRGITNPQDFPSRASSGDCLVGAMAAGADEDAARKIALETHQSPDLRDQLTSSGGLFMGAVGYLTRGEIDG